MGLAIHLYSLLLFNAADFEAATKALKKDSTDAIIMVVYSDTTADCNAATLPSTTDKKYWKHFCHLLCSTT